MKKVSHRKKLADTHYSAKPSHYNQEAKYYDAFVEENSALINRTLEKILKTYHVKTLLDLTCGTGAQALWFAKRNLRVVSVDINANMLKIAKEKSKNLKLNIKFLKGDMRVSQLGIFDAVITIFNSIGHLTKDDFEKTMQNIHANLKKDGIYIFDINNLNFLLQDNQITTLTIDWQTVSKNENTTVRKIQYSTINKEGILTSYTTSFEQKDGNQATVSKNIQTLQVYRAKQLKDMLNRNGFKVLHHYALDGSKFSDKKTDRFLTVAKKISV